MAELSRNHGPVYARGPINRSALGAGHRAAPLVASLNRTLDALGPRPREGLGALAAYGLSDTEIARYHDVSCEAVNFLRVLWDIGSEG